MDFCFSGLPEKFHPRIGRAEERSNLPAADDIDAPQIPKALLTPNDFAVLTGKFGKPFRDIAADKYKIHKLYRQFQALVRRCRF